MSDIVVGSTVCVNTVNGAWEYWYNILSQMDLGDSSRDGDVCGEVLHATTIIKDPTRNIVTSSIRKMPMRYAVGELMWYLSGSNKVNDIGAFSKVWENLSDDGVHVNSAYGYRIFKAFGFDQWEYAKRLLIENPNSRQAVIHIKDPNPDPTKDLPCTLALQYFIRDGALHASTYMRSNDIWLGFPFDTFTFTCLQMMMAFQLGVNIGAYSHTAGSLHMYQRNLPDIEPKTN